MPSVVLNLHAHLPLRLKKYGFFDIGRSDDYFDMDESRQVLERATKDCYLPINAAMLKLIRRHRGGFRVSCSISGMLLEQLEEGRKAVLESFRRLADTACVEFVGAPWHHSLASFFSEEEFRRQIALHRRSIHALFGQVPRAFRNTELIYGNDVARTADSMGFRVILACGSDRLPDCNAEVLYRPTGCGKLKVLFRQNRLSDDFALRPSGPVGQDRATEFLRRLTDGYRGDEIVNLFIDYETFCGDDQSTAGVLGFLDTIPGILLKRRNWRFLTPSGMEAEHEPAGKIDMPDRIFRTDSEGDDSAWLGNHMQIDAVRTLYSLEDRVRATKNRKMIGAWRNLQASDYFHYMSTKDLSDKTGHRTMNPFASPYDAYIHYMNILKDFSGRIAGKTGVRS